jgi:hypothetical protein
LNLRRVLLETKFSSRLVLPVASSLRHLLALHRLLQDDLAALEVAGGVRAHRVLAHVAAAVLVDGALALGAGAQRSAGGEVHRLAVGFGGLASSPKSNSSFQLPISSSRTSLSSAVKGQPALERKPSSGPILLVAQEGLGLGGLEGAAGRDLGEAEAAAGTVGRAGRPRAGEAAVVLLHHTAAVRARRGQRGVVAGDGVAVVLLGLAHDALGHLGDLGHEGLALQPALLHLGELVLPVAGELGLGEVLDGQPAQQRHQLEGLGGGHQLAAVAQHVLLEDQPFDDGRARGRRAQALVGHGLAQLVVVDQLAGAFHGAEQRGLGVARRRLGLQRLHVHALGAHHLARGHRHQVGVGLLRLLAVDGQPAGVDQHLAVGLEGVLGAARGLHLADARGDHELGRRVEHRQEALDHHVVELGLDLGQARWAPAAWG